MMGEFFVLGTAAVLTGSSAFFVAVALYMGTHSVWGAIGILLTASLYYGLWRILRALHRMALPATTSLDDPGAC
jgi:hypothetical protein